MEKSERHLLSITAVGGMITGITHEDMVPDCLTKNFRGKAEQWDGYRWLWKAPASFWGSRGPCTCVGMSACPALRYLQGKSEKVLSSHPLPDLRSLYRYKKWRLVWRDELPTWALIFCSPGGPSTFLVAPHHFPFPKKLAFFRVDSSYLFSIYFLWTSSVSVITINNIRLCCWALFLSCVQFFATLWTICTLPGSSVHDSPGKNIEVGCRAFPQGIFPSQGSNLGLMHCRWFLYCLSHQGSPLHMLLTHKLISQSRSLPKTWWSRTDVGLLHAGPKQ